MSDQNEIINEEPDENILNFKTARILVIFLLAVIIVAFIFSYVKFQIAADKGEHAKYLWIERNIPKGYPDTVYKDRVIYMDTSMNAIHDSVHHDTVIKEVKVVQQVPAARGSSPAPAPYSAPPPPTPQEAHHLTDDEKSSIVSQIESLKKANGIQSNDIEIAHVYHTNGAIFMQELKEFLSSKGYRPDDGGGNRMTFGNRKGFWVVLKQDPRRIAIGIGMF